MCPESDAAGDCGDYGGGWFGDGDGRSIADVALPDEEVAAVDVAVGVGIALRDGRRRWRRS